MNEPSTRAASSRFLSSSAGMFLWLGKHILKRCGKQTTASSTSRKQLMMYVGSLTLCCTLFLCSQQILYLEHTFGHEAHNNPYHVPIIRTSLTRNLGVLYPDVRDELDTSSRELIPPSHGKFSMPFIVNSANALMSCIRLDQGSSVRGHHAIRL